MNTPTLMHEALIYSNHAKGNASVPLCGDNKGAVENERMNMANQVVLKTECLHVKKGGIELLITQGGKTFGTLTVSNATVSWFPKGAKKPIECNWKKFGNLFGGIEK